MTIDLKKYLLDWKVWLVVASMAMGVAKAIQSRDHCERIAQVHEIFNDSTYAVQTIDLCVKR